MIKRTGTGTTGTGIKTRDKILIFTEPDNREIDVNNKNPIGQDTK